MTALEATTVTRHLSEQALVSLDDLKVVVAGTTVTVMQKFIQSKIWKCKKHIYQRDTL